MARPILLASQCTLPIRRIAVAYDGSVGADRALQAAVDIADPDTPVGARGVGEPPVGAGFGADADGATQQVGVDRLGAHDLGQSAAGAAAASFAKAVARKALGQGG